MLDRSIFAGVVRTEDTLTNLLRNLLDYDADFANAFLEVMLPQNLRDLASEQHEAMTQVTLPGHHGRADLLINAKHFLLLVEIKRDPYCGLTDNQDVRDSINRGYIPYLRQNARQDQIPIFSFLAPASWVHSQSVRESQSRLLELESSFCTWEQVSLAISRGSFKPFVIELGKLLKRDLMTIEFTEEEISKLRADDRIRNSASLKLAKTIAYIQKLLKEQDTSKFCFKMNIGTLDRSAKEAGFEVSIDDRKALWIGIWDETSFAAVAAVRTTWDDASLSMELLNSFNLRSEFCENGVWRAFSIVAPLTDTNGDPIGSVVELIMKFAIQFSSTNSLG